MKLWICLSVLLLGCSAGASPEEPRKAVIVAPVAVRQDVPRPAAFASFPTSPVNASSIKGLPVPTPTPTGAVLTVAAGPSLIWNVPAAGVMLASTTPAPVSASAGAVGVGSTAARSDHVHLLPTVPTTKGGFGQDVSTGLTDGYIAKVVSGAIVIAAIAAGDLPTGIDVAKLAAGTVTNTVFGYLANVTSDIQTQLNALLPASSNKLPPTPTAANKLLYDTGSTYAETAACSSTSTVLVGGSPPACAAVPDAALSSNVVTLTGTQTLTNKTISGSSNTITNLNLNASATSGGVVYAAVTGEIAITFSTSTKYMQAPTGSTAGAASETRLVCLGPRFASGTYKARNLQVHLVTAPGASGTNTFKVNLWHAGSWTTTGTPTCAISGATGNQDCSDSSTAITVTQGDCVGIEDAANIFSAGAGATATVEVTN